MISVAIGRHIIPPPDLGHIRDKPYSGQRHMSLLHVDCWNGRYATCTYELVFPRASVPEESNRCPKLLR